MKDYEKNPCLTCRYKYKECEHGCTKWKKWFIKSWNNIRKKCGLYG